MPPVPSNVGAGITYRGLVSVKGVIVSSDSVLLLRNEREE
jgi:hypothetical protein